MDLRKHITGKGIDVSRFPQLKNVEHHFIKPDNFYSLKKIQKPESFDFIYSKNLINETKFYRILIQEWFYACKVGGKIIIEMASNNILDFEEVIKECGLILRTKIKIIEKEYNTKSKKGFLVLKKLKPTLEKGDEIDKWSFGILTNGTKDDWVDKEIKSILDLKIPYVEIIVCGNYKNKHKYKIKRINFNPEIAWITKKKNMICESAKYENIVITHDRYIFNEDWYKGMKKYGNYFEVLSCVIKDPNGKRTDEWNAYGTDLNDKTNFGKQGWLEYRDWDKNGYIDGGLYILKKSVWKKVKWNNNLLLNEGEDIEISKDFYNFGFIARFNPYSTCITSSIKRKWPIYEFNNKKLGKIIKQPISNKIFYLIKRYVLKKHYFVLKDIHNVLKKHYKKN